MEEQITITRDLYDHHDEVGSKFHAEAGLTESIIRKISEYKKEPQWMLDFRLNALKLFNEMPMPAWGPSLQDLDLNSITYFNDPDAQQNSKSWDDVPENIKRTFDKLGIPEAEKKALAGVGGQFDSTTVYHNLKQELQDQGVIFLDMDEALQKHPDLVKEYFMTRCVRPHLHKFAALHAAVWSGGTFLYIPKGVTVDQPVQAYFRMNSINFGQFEHTLIIVEEEAQAQYIEGCSAPKFNSNSIHAGCVEVIVKKGARMRYSSVENWSINTYNLNTKRALVYGQGYMEWIGGNLGSGVTMLYPTSLLLETGARADHISIAYAGKDQNQDTGAKIYHLAPQTTSLVTSKSISKDGGIAGYRGLINVAKQAHGSKCSVECDALMIDSQSQSNTYPTIDVANEDVHIAHEARVGKISDEEVFYLMSRGLSEEDAVKLIVNGFMEPIVKELPLEYASELKSINRTRNGGLFGLNQNKNSTMIIKRALGVTTDFPDLTSEETTQITETISGTLTDYKTITIDAIQNTDSSITITEGTSGNIIILTKATHAKTNTTITVDKNCDIVLTLVFEEQEHHMNTTTINIQEGSTVNINGLVRGSGQVITDIITNLQGEDATGNAHIFIEGEGIYDVNYTTDHQAPKTNSDTVVKGLITTKVINRNIVRIGQNAKDSQGYEQSHFLLLNKQARAVSIPDLEIHNHNVQCSHGATISSIDEEQIYYLQARGLSQEQAKRMIINGFRDESMRRIPGIITNTTPEEEDHE